MARRKIRPERVRPIDMNSLHKECTQNVVHKMEDLYADLSSDESDGESVKDTESLKDSDDEPIEILITKPADEKSIGNSSLDKSVSDSGEDDRTPLSEEELVENADMEVINIQSSDDEEVIDIGVKTEIVEENDCIKNSSMRTFTIQPKQVPAKQFRLINGTFVNGTLLPRITLAGSGTTWRTIPIQNGDGQTITLSSGNLITAPQVERFEM